MGLNTLAYALSKGYTDESIAGGGISAGKNCTIQSITPIPATEVRPAGQRVTFAWYLDNGTAQTSVMNVYNGADGQDGQGIDRMYVNEEGHLVVVYDNGTEEDVGEITVPSFQADWNETDPLENSYIKNKPSIPAAQVNSDWNASSGVAEILNKPNIPTKVSDLQNDSGFEANAIESISVNGTAVAPDANKNVNIVVQGGGGTSDYSDLTNKPSINNVTLSGNKTASDLGLATPSDIVQSDWNESDDTSKAYIANKPTIPAAQEQADWNEADSADPAYIKNKPSLGTAAAKDSTNAVTANSTDLVESGAVKAAIDNAVASVYEPGGSKTCAELVSGLLVVANKGKVYNVTDSGTTTADFVEGAGEPIYAGEDVAIINIGTDANPVYKFNKMGGKVDLSNYYNKTDSDTHYLKKDGASGNYQTVNGSVAVQGEVWAKDNIALSNVAESLAYFNSGTKADKLYNIGDRFVYQGMLLEAIQTINANSDIVITEGVTQNAEKVTLDEVIEDVASDIPDVSGKTNLTVIAGVEATTIASKAYAVGDRLVYNGKLYSVTSSIIDGGSIIIEGASANVVETTVDEAINSGSSKVYKHFNITAKSGSIIKLSGFGAFDNDSLGETLLLREKGGETILFAYGSYYGDINEDSNYIARRFSENATNYITSIVVNKANRDIYVTVASGGDLDVAQIGGVRRDFAYEKNATIPSSNIQTVTIKDVAVGSISGKADKVSNATTGDFAGLDSNGNLTDSGKKASDFTGKSFDGTSQEWAALSAAQKAEYADGLVLINNDTANAMLVDSTPTENSNNLVKSGGVYAHRVVAGKQANTTLGFCATAEGSNNQASGNYSHAEGRLTAADAECAHSEGYTSLAKGNYSHAGGYWNLATKKAQTVIGRLNDYEEYTAADADGEYAFMIGNGTSNNARHNAFAVKWDGTHEINGDVIIGQHYDSAQSQNVGSNLTVSGTLYVTEAADYAERFETLEECPVGRFVTLDGEKIRLAQPGDDYILGVTSENPAFIGDSNLDGVPVGLLGKLWVEHDGTAEVNGYVCCGKDGIATMELHRQCVYRVMAVDGNRCKILVK